MRAALGFVSLIAIISAGYYWLHQPTRSDEWKRCQRNAPLYIAPHFENLNLYEDWQVRSLKEIADGLEPEKGGNVRMAYTKVIFPYALYKQTPQGWQLHTNSLDEELQQAADLGMPFVLYIFSNHFLPGNKMPMVDELAANPDNLMRFRDGSTPNEIYFETKIVPIRLTIDESEPVAYYRQLALNAIAEKLAAFDTKHPNLLVGVMLNGETHYLYEDFFSGTGNFTNPRFTDYHPKEIAAFADYLKGTPLAGQAETIVELPMNQYEWGTISISGWLHPVTEGDTIEIWLGGEKVGEADYHVNRMDVFRDKQNDIDDITPNSGFAYDLDYRELPAGRHLIEVLFNHKDKRYIVGSKWVHILNADGIRSEAVFPGPFEREGLPFGDIIGYVDLPADGVSVRYSPLAEAWLAFRARRIQDVVEHMASSFRDAGFGKDRVFSYQLTPWLKGNWNVAMFGVEPSFFNSDVMSPGITMYGGNINNPRIFDLVERGTPYGIPEMHPQAAASKEWMHETLENHYCHGARFISPYFIKLYVDEKAPPSDHGKMNIAPNNTRWGSNIFYETLREFLAY